GCHRFVGICEHEARVSRPRRDAFVHFWACCLRGSGLYSLRSMASLARTILEEHLERGELVPGQEIGLRVDQTLAQDATGTMACMQFELFEVDRVQVESAVVYVDHNILQIDFKNPDDHRFLQAIAARYGLWFSRPGNGICHY